MGRVNWSPLYLLETLAVISGVIAIVGPPRDLSVDHVDRPQDAHVATKQFGCVSELQHDTAGAAVHLSENSGRIRSTLAPGRHVLRPNFLQCVITIQLPAQRRIDIHREIARYEFHGRVAVALGSECAGPPSS